MDVYLDSDSDLDLVADANAVAVAFPDAMRCRACGSLPSFQVLQA